MSVEQVVKKEDPNAPKSHPQYSLLDISKKNDIVWFAKVPPVLYDDWAKITKRVLIGEITMTPQPSGHPKLTVHFNESAVSSFPYEMLPKIFDLDVDDKIDQSRYFFSYKKDSGIVRLIGRVNCEAKFIGDLGKMSQIRTYLDKQIKKSKKREKFIDDDLPVPPPPETSFLNNTKSEKKKKDKRIRKPRDTIMREVLDLIKDGNEWKLKDLARIIDQDQKFIQDVVNQVAEYDQKNKTYHIRPDLT